MSELKSKIQEIAASIQNQLMDEEVPVITFFQSGDELMYNETSDNKGISGTQLVGGAGLTTINKPFTRKADPNAQNGNTQSGSRQQGTNSGNDGNAQNQDGTGEGDNTDNGQAGSDDEEGSKQDLNLDDQPAEGQENNTQGNQNNGEGGGGGDDNKIKVGSKVRIKSTGQEGIVANINQDGTYTVTPLPVPDAPPIQGDNEKMEEGGILEIENASMPISQVSITENRAFEHPGVDVIGDFTGEEIELVAQDGSGGKDSQESQSGSSSQNGNNSGGGKSSQAGSQGQSQGQGQGQGEGQGEQGEGNSDQQGQSGSQQQGQGRGQQQMPPEPIVLDKEELQQRLNALNNVKWKLPTFALAFFNEHIESETEMFYTKSTLALWWRMGKGIFSKKNPMSQGACDDFRQIIFNYHHYYKFVKANCILIGNEYFYREDPTLPMKKQDLIDNDALMEAYNFLDSMDELFAFDAQMYRMISLIAILKPSLFISGQYLNVHMDFMFKYFKMRVLPATNLSTLLTSNKISSIGDIYDRIDDSLDVYNIMRTPDRNDFIILKFYKVLQKVRTGNTDFRKFLLSELPDGITDVTKDLMQCVSIFYQNALNLRDNYGAKEIVMNNIKVLLDLQDQYIKVPLSEFSLEVAIGD